MKKLTLFLFVLLLCFSLFACDKDFDKNDDSTDDTKTDVSDDENKDDDDDENKDDDDDSSTPAVTTMTEEEWKAAFASIDTESVSVHSEYPTSDSETEIQIIEITDTVVHFLNGGVEAYSQKLLNNTYVNYVKNDGEQSFTQLQDTSNEIFNYCKNIHFAILSFADLFDDFEYDAELDAYVCDKAVTATITYLSAPEYKEEIDCSSTVIKFKDGKLVEMSTVADKGSYKYSDIANGDLKIPDSVINNAIQEIKVSLNQTSATLDVGDTLTLTATTSPEIDASDLTWTSSDTSVATVSTSGVVTGVKAGTATITVKAPGGNQATCQVTVDIYTDIVVPSGAPTYNVTWDRTELKYALTDTDVDGELTSGCKKYYSATAANAFEKIDTLVRNRNLHAAKQANVTVRFDYETAGGGWGGNIHTITANATSGSSQSPDIFASFVYDLSCAQMRGCFANLLQTGKANYFRFNEPDYNPVGVNYFDDDAGEGYFYDYMRSLTLSDDKMYILASNYTIDVIRSMLVVPMNVEQMSTLVGIDEATGENLSYTGDMQAVSDFYDLVWRTPELVAQNAKYKEGFTYDVIAHYANKFYSQATDPNDVLSGKLAFAAGASSGLASTGLLYSTNVTIISKTANADGTYTYAYPEQNNELQEFSYALYDLFKDRNGVLAVHSSDAGISGVYSTELHAIRDKFSKNHILFGGIVTLGSLDETEYQSMRVGDDAKGFGILPIPLYRSTDAYGNPEEYKTVIHNVAKAVAIAKGTKNFTQCTAYLDCLSRMSQDIVEEYYESNLVCSCEGMAGVFNKVMLTYIRNHARGCFDKTFEDYIISRRVAIEDVAAADEQLHMFISKNNFVHANLFNDYVESASKNEAWLQEAVDTWNGFTD